MKVLTEENTVVDLTMLNEPIHYSVLSFEDYKNPDFYFRPIKWLEEFNSASVALEIGDLYKIVVPLHWSILCSDYEYVQAIPLYEINARDYDVICLNPIAGFMPEYLKLRIKEIYPSTSWTCPPVGEKDMIVLPLPLPAGITRTRKDSVVDRGPICAIFAPNKIEVNKPISDIWSD